MGRSSSTTRRRTPLPSVGNRSVTDEKAFRKEKHLYPNQNDQYDELLFQAGERRECHSDSACQGQTLDDPDPDLGRPFFHALNSIHRPVPPRLHKARVKPATMKGWNASRPCQENVLILYLLASSRWQEKREKCQEIVKTPEAPDSALGDQKRRNRHVQAVPSSTRHCFPRSALHAETPGSGDQSLLPSTPSTAVCFGAPPSLGDRGWSSRYCCSRLGASG